MSYAPIYAANLNRASIPEDISDTSPPISVLNSAIQRTQSKLSGSTPPRDGHPPIIVHSHLSWDWVWQRPQQFLSRLSQRRRILFVEMHRPDPQLVRPTARVKPLDTYPNITLLQMQFPLWRWHNSDWVDAQRRSILQEALSDPLRGQFDAPVQWFYDPMAVTAFAGKMQEICTVYDCMDELSKFQGTPPTIVERERELLQVADVVFTGGRKLFE